MTPHDFSLSLAVVEYYLDHVQQLIDACAAAGYDPVVEHFPKVGKLGTADDPRALYSEGHAKLLAQFWLEPEVSAGVVTGVRFAVKSFWEVSDMWAMAQKLDLN